MKSLKVYLQGDIEAFRKKQAENCDNIFKRIENGNKRRALIEVGIRPAETIADIPFPPFVTNLSPDIPENMCLQNVWPVKWNEYNKKIENVYHALFDYDETPPPWTPFTELETIAYFFSFHVFDEFNSHPTYLKIVDEKLHHPDFPEFTAPSLFYFPLDAKYFPWSRLSELMIKPALPVLEEYMKPLPAGRVEHGWLVRDIFLLNENLYKLAEKHRLHETLRETIPYEQLDYELTNNTELKLKRWLDSDLDIIKKPPAGTYERDILEWLLKMRADKPDPTKYSPAPKAPTPVLDDDEEEDEIKPAPKKTKPKPNNHEPNKPDGNSLF